MCFDSTNLHVTHILSLLYCDISRSAIFYLFMSTLHVPAYQFLGLKPSKQETDTAMTNVQGVISDGDKWVFRITGKLSLDCLS